MVDMIAHPPYYTFGDYESRKVMKALADVQAETFNGAVALDLATAFKYMVRCGRKNRDEAVKDLDKAINYLWDARMEIQRLDESARD